MLLHPVTAPPLLQRGQVEHVAGQEPRVRDGLAVDAQPGDPAVGVDGSRTCVTRAVAAPA